MRSCFRLGPALDYAIEPYDIARTDSTDSAAAAALSALLGTADRRSQPSPSQSASSCRAFALALGSTATRDPRAALMEPARQHHNVTLGILTLAGIAFSLQQTMVFPALPTFQDEFDTSTAWATWVLTGFLVSAAVTTPILGRLGDQYGKGADVARQPRRSSSPAASAPPRRGTSGR